MTLAAVDTAGSGPLVAVAILGALGFCWLLPSPKRRSPALGVFAVLAAGVVLAVWVMNRFGAVAAGKVEAFLFWLFSISAVSGAAVFVTQRNPARGAIAFAFVIISTCGLFLLLAAPFLMAATIIIYAGAIVVTFLFVLMLSQTRLASDENDRSREPLLGSLAGFSFLGLVLLAVFTSTPQVNAEAALPARPLLPDERATLAEVAQDLQNPPAERDKLLKYVEDLKDKLAPVIGQFNALERPNPIKDRLSFSRDREAQLVKQKSDDLQIAARDRFNAIENHLLTGAYTPEVHKRVTDEMTALADECRLLAGRGELPARNVANLGYTLYSEYILAVELAGAVLLVATIGAVLIASRKGEK